MTNVNFGIEKLEIAIGRIYNSQPSDSHMDEEIYQKSASPTSKINLRDSKIQCSFGGEFIFNFTNFFLNLLTNNFNDEGWLG